MHERVGGHEYSYVGQPFQWENQHGQIYLYVSKTTGKEEECQTTHEVHTVKFLLCLHSKKNVVSSA